MAAQPPLPPADILAAEIRSATAARPSQRVGAVAQVHPRRLSPDELHAVEDLVNTQIARDLPVTVEIMPLDQAVAQGALAL